MNITKDMKWTLIDEIRRYCIKHEYYTCGSNEHYERMFETATTPRDTLEETVFETAMDIYYHSEVDTDKEQVIADLTEIYIKIIKEYTDEEEI